MMEDGNKPEEPFDHDALVDKTNALLEETERLGDTWHQGKDSTESVRQLRKGKADRRHPTCWFL